MHLNTNKYITASTFQAPQSSVQSVRPTFIQDIVILALTFIMSSRLYLHTYCTVRLPCSPFFHGRTGLAERFFCGLLLLV